MSSLSIFPLLTLAFLSLLSPGVKANFFLQIIAEDLVFPWGLEFLGDQELIVTELGGTLRYINLEENISKRVSGTPSVYRAGQGGLFDVLRHPDFNENKQIYLSCLLYTSPSPRD